jgi:hypothetical protein
MDIVYFVLGMVTVLLIIGVVGIVGAYTSVRKLEDRVDTVERRIDIEVQSIEGNMVNLNSKIDSRFDRFENRIKNKELIKG